MPGQPVWQKDVKVDLGRIRIFSCCQCYGTYSFKKNQNETFKLNETGSNPDPFINAINIQCIQEIEYIHIEEYPYQCVRYLDYNKLCIYCHAEIVLPSEMAFSFRLLHGLLNKW